MDTPKLDPVAAMTADLLGLADVHRWTVIKTGRTQSVAEHSFNVAVLVIELCTRLNVPTLDACNAISWAIIHDLPETLTGDIDGKFKRDYPDLRKSINAAEADAFPHYTEAYSHIPSEVNALVKLADKMEAIMFIRKWGVGGRAEAVAMDLEGAPLHAWITIVAAAYQTKDNNVADMVTRMIERDRYETYTVQTRPNLAAASPAVADAVGVEASDNGGTSAR